jgi:hypothetical protein
MRRYRAALGGATLILAHAGSVIAQKAAVERARVSAAAAAYLDSALAIMRANFLHRNRIDWAKLERETFAQAADA